MEHSAPGVGQREHLGRPAAAAVPVNPLLTGLDQTLGEQRVEVPAHPGGGQA
jgi:hypothetical protein